MLQLDRDHRSIENRLDYVRDRTFDENRLRVRKRAAPHMMASLRNLASGLLRLAGATSDIAAAWHFFMRNTERAMEILGVAPVRSPAGGSALPA